MPGKERMWWNNLIRHRGLADVKLRRTPAKAIKEALKQNGIYQIFFVLTLSSGKVWPEDLVTIWFVLMHALNIKSFIILVA